MSEYVVEEPSDSSASWRVHELIVRCRDCKSCKKTIYGLIYGLTCHHFSMSSGAGWPVEPDGYCAWGERKAGA